MQGLAKTSSVGTSYSSSQVLAQLFSVKPTQEAWVFRRLSADRSYLADLTPYVDYATNAPEIQHDTTRAVKRTLRIRIRGDAYFDPFRDLVQPFYRLTMPDGGYVEWPLGVFSTVPFDAEIQSAQTWRDMTCPDLSQILVDATFPKSFAASRGTSYITAVQLIVASTGSPTSIPVYIPDAGTQLPAALSWDYGTSRLQAVNDLLAAINYFPAWIDELGRLRSEPIPDWNTVLTTATFDATSNQASVRNAITIRADPSQAYNQVLVIGEDPRRQAVTALYANTNPASLVSTTHWHAKLLVERDSKIPDFVSAWNRARTLCQQHARLTSQFTFQSMAWPASQDNDRYMLAYQSQDEGLVSLPFLEIGWTHRCKAGEPTDHLLTQIVAA